MKSWYDANAFAVWGANGPSWEETKKHSKGMRRLEDIPTYFRKYRRGKKKAGHGGDDDYSDSESETNDGDLAPTPIKKRRPRCRANSVTQQHQQEQIGEAATARQQETPQVKPRQRAASTSQVTISAAALTNAAAGAPAMTLFGVAVPFLGTWRSRSASAPAMPAVQITQLDQPGGRFGLATHLGQVLEDCPRLAQDPPHGPHGPAHVLGSAGAVPLPVPLVAVAGPPLEQYVPRAAVEKHGSLEGAAAAPPLLLRDLQRPHEQEHGESFTAQLGVYSQPAGFVSRQAQMQVNRDYEEQLGPFSTFQQQRLLLQQEEDGLRYQGLVPQPKPEPMVGCQGAVSALGDPLEMLGGRPVEAANVRRHIAAIGGGAGMTGGMAGGGLEPGPSSMGAGAGAGGGGIVGLDSTMLMQVPSSALPPDMRFNSKQSGMLERLFPRNSTLKMVHSLFNRWSVQQDFMEAETAMAAPTAGRVGPDALAIAPVSPYPDLTADVAGGGAVPVGCARQSTVPVAPVLHAQQNTYRPPVVTTGGSCPALAPLSYAQQQTHQQQQQQALVLHPHLPQDQKWRQHGLTGQDAPVSPGVLPPPRPVPCGVASGGGRDGSSGSGGSGGDVDAVGYIAMPTPQAHCAQHGYLQPPSGDYATPAKLGKRGRDDDSPLSALTGVAVSATVSSRKLQRGLSGVLRPLLSWMSLGRRNGGGAAAANTAPSAATATPAHGGASAAAASAASGGTGGDAGVPYVFGPGTDGGGGGGGSVDGTSPVGLGLALGLALDLPSAADGGVVGLLSGFEDSRLLDGLPSVAGAVPDGAAERATAGAGGAGEGCAEGKTGHGRTAGGGLHGIGAGGGSGYRSGGDGGEREAAAAVEAAGVVAVMAAVEGDAAGPSAKAPWPVADTNTRCEAGLSCMAADGYLPTPFVVPEVQRRVSESTFATNDRPPASQPGGAPCAGADAGDCGGSAVTGAGAFPALQVGLGAEMHTRHYAAGGIAVHAPPQEAAVLVQPPAPQQSRPPQDGLPGGPSSQGLGGSLLRRLSTSLSDYFKFLAR